MNKVCECCKQKKCKSEFNKRSAAKDGLQSRCKSCAATYSMIWRKANPDYGENWYIANKDKHSAAMTAWYIVNKDKHSADIAAWAKANRPKRNVSDSKRRAAELNATPCWLTVEDWRLIEDFYIQAHYLTDSMKIKYHVDHIVPLQGKIVCGLHVPWNLQVIPASQNIGKRNKLQLPVEQLWS
jgi:hypothetical protein